MWRDGERIVVAFTANAEEHADVLEQDVLGGSSTVEARTVKHSLQELRGLQERIAHDRARGEDSDLPKPIAELAGRFDLDIDIKRNVVVVHAEQATPELQEAFRSFYGTSSISLEEGLSAPG